MSSSEVWSVQLDRIPRRFDTIHPVDRDYALCGASSFDADNHVVARDAARVAFRRARKLFREIRELTWRLAEVHSTRIILLVVVLIALQHFCALNLGVIVIVSIAVCLPALACPTSLFLCVYLALAFLSRRVYQLHLFPKNATDGLIEDVDMDSNCSNQTFAQWLGFEKEDAVQGDLAGFVAVIAMIAFYLCIRYRQKHHRAKLGEPDPPTGIIFPNADPTKLDASLADCAKFFFNYGFYKFGLEISLTMMVIVAWVRMDALGGLLMIWLLAFVILPRSAVRVLWPFFLLYLAVLLPLQYAMALGLPPNYCIKYPWTDWLSGRGPNWQALNDNLLLFLDLANYRAPASRFYDYLVADFFLLMFVAAQECVFRKESPSHPAGPNYSIYRSGEYVLRKDNPRYDFVVEQRSFVDFLKLGIFMYGHWVTMVMVLTAGLGGTSLFALGYIILAFWLLWQGNNLYTMKNYARTLARWNLLAIYTVSVMFCKVALQVLGCVFLNEVLDKCIVRQLFSIVCVNELSNEHLKEITRDPPYCQVTATETKIGYDTVAFAFIIFQLRILHSWYFQHCMIDFRCEIIQANRGAVLINQLIEKEMREQNQQQRVKFQEIKDRTAAIRARYEEQQRRGSFGAFTPHTYAQDRRSAAYVGGGERPASVVDEDDPLPYYDPRYISIIPAKRAGDYYMFDYEPDSDELVQPAESTVPEVTPGASDYNRLDPAQLLHTAIERDLDIPKTLNAVDVAEKIKDEELRMIAAVGSTSKVDTIPGTASPTSAQAFGEPSLQEEPTQEDEEEKTLADTLLSYCLFAYRLFVAVLDWFSAFLNRQSREHRYVAYVLNKEKQKLKSVMYDDLYDANKSMSDLRQRWENRNLHMVSSEADITRQLKTTELCSECPGICRLEDEVHTTWEQRNVFTRFVLAIGNAIGAHTDLLCYTFAIIAHARWAGLITLPFPLLVLLWGTLASPRPAKIFWVTLIAYTELVIIVKFIFQFEMWDWNKKQSQVKDVVDPYAKQYILGLQQESLFAVWDVALLVALFFHRYMLRRLGLWKDANISDTFEEIDRPERQAAGGIDLEQIQLSDTLAGAGSADVLENTESQVPRSAEDTKKGVVATFFDKLFHPKFRYIRDLYPLMFFLDIICFLIIAFGYKWFGEGGTGDVVHDIQSNRVPLPFVIMLLTITLMIVMDRALYLRKAVVAKLIYQLVSIILFHIWIFYVLPWITRRLTVDNKGAQILYAVKCIYFVISAWQIRNGYPSLCIGNLLTHSYGLLNMVLFKVWLIVPFLFELRTAIDWTWTDTSMPLFDYFNMENFYATIYNLKCARTFEQNFPAPRGIPKGAVVKYLMGLPMILIIVLLIWLPLLAFSLLNRIGIQLVPESVKMTVGIAGYPPIYTMESMGLYVEELTADEFESLTRVFENATDVKYGRQAVSFIDEYAKPDIRKVKFRPEGELFWSVTPQSLEALQHDLSNLHDQTLKFTVHLEFQRPRAEKSKEPQRHTNEFSIDITEESDLRKQLIDVLGTPPGQRSAPVIVDSILPMYVIVPNEGQVGTADALLNNVKKELEKEGKAKWTDPINVTFSGLNMTLDRTTSTRSQWIVQLVIPAEVQKFTPFQPEKVAYGSDPSATYMTTVAFVDRVFPSFLSTYVQGGIITMYVAVVLLAGRLIRGLVTNGPLDVMISEIPNPDYLLKICLDIYLVREAHDFVLEQDLFAKLIFLFRSPATLIKWTRYKTKRE